MKQTTLKVKISSSRSVSLPMTWVHTLVVGSGAAGLNAALQLRANGIEDVLIVTEGLEMGTSINTGSDKQTYYKLSMFGGDADAPGILAESFFAGGSMHGDLALVEASLSARAFINLVNLGIPFPKDEYGQFVGYKTDHDPRQRATSVGPYTSREMCRALIREVISRNVPVREDLNVVELLVAGQQDDRRVIGAVAVSGMGKFEAFGAANVVFAVGGPGGLYKTSVYPNVHTGAIGVALMAGAMGQNLPESQYGMASTKFRWNVSGTYMQVVPRFISTAPDGESDEKEFLREYFPSVGEMNSLVFLKGYQWPFDSRKVKGGSSIVDILVYIESVIRGRRVFLDFRQNPADFSFDTLSKEALEYLTKSQGLKDTPIVRLQTMNPAAIEVYAEHGIDLCKEPLEIAVCAQHNNGGLAANMWWESLNIAHLFPIGEVNGSHGVYRPGGAALNSGQVGGFSAAEHIADSYRTSDLDEKMVERKAREVCSSLMTWAEKCAKAKSTWQEETKEFQQRMTEAASHIRSLERLEKAVSEGRKQWKRIRDSGCRFWGKRELRESAKVRYLCFAHLAYLEAIRFALNSGVGSRGSAIVLNPADGEGLIHPKLGGEWRIRAEDTGFREKVQETELKLSGEVANRWVPRRPIPESDAWFETTWARYRKSKATA